MSKECVYIVMSEKRSKMVRVNITMPEDTHRRFKEYCEKQHRSISAQLSYWAELAMKGLLKEEEIREIDRSQEP